MPTAPATTDSAGRLVFADRDAALSYALARFQLWHRRQRVTMIPAGERELPGYVWRVTVESPVQAAQRTRRELRAAVRTVARVAAAIRGRHA